MPVRRAKLPQDIDALFELNRLISPDETKERFIDDLHRSGEFIFVAEDGSGIAGLFSYSFPWWDSVAISMHFIVRPDCRNKGIGSALLKTGITCAKENACTFLTIQTANWNSNAIRLYEKFGFVRKATFPDYCGPKNELVWLDKDLR